MGELNRRKFLASVGSAGLAGIMVPHELFAFSRSVLATRHFIIGGKGEIEMETIIIPNTYTISNQFSPFISSLEKGCAYVFKGIVTQEYQIAMFFSIGTGATSSTSSSDGAYRGYRWRTANGGFMEPIGIWDGGSTATKVNAGDEYYKIPIV